MVVHACNSSMCVQKQEESEAILDYIEVPSSLAFSAEKDPVSKK